MRLPTFYEQNLIPNWGNISVSTSVEDWEVGETIIIDTDK